MSSSAFFPFLLPFVLGCSSTRKNVLEIWGWKLPFPGFIGLFVFCGVFDFVVARGGKVVMDAKYKHMQPTPNARIKIFPSVQDLKLSNNYSQGQEEEKSKHAQNLTNLE